MTESAPSPDPRDPLEDLVFETLEHMATRGQAALEDAVREHPDVADELRRRVGVLVAAGLVEPAPAQEVVLPRRIGPYEILHELGEGGMGVVVAAHDTVLDRPVALKLIRPGVVDRPSMRERFEREVRTAASLQHPGIARVYDFGEVDGQPYLVMESIEGSTLTDIIDGLADRDPSSLVGSDFATALRDLGHVLPPGIEESAVFTDSWTEACARIVRDVAEALEHAHRAGVVHRDVKSSNVMLTSGGRVVLLDFGLSWRSSERELTVSGVRVGSLPYAAPELTKSFGEPDVRGDLYSLGVVFHELLTLHLPFRGSNSVELIRTVQRGHATPIRARNRAVPRAFQRVAARAMHVDPARRHRSAALLGEDLSAALEGRAPVSADDGLWRWFVDRWRIRPWSTAAACTVAAVLAATVPTVQFVRANEARETARDDAIAVERLDTVLAAFRDLQYRLPRAPALDGTELVRLRLETLQRMHALRAQIADRLGDREELTPRLDALRRTLALDQSEALLQAGFDDRARAEFETYVEGGYVPSSDADRLRAALVEFALGKAEDVAILDRALASIEDPDGWYATRLRSVRANHAEATNDERIAAADELRAAVAAGEAPAPDNASVYAAQLDLSLSGTDPAIDARLARAAEELERLEETSSELIQIRQTLAWIHERRAECAARAQDDRARRAHLAEASRAWSELAASFPASTKLAESERRVAALIDTLAKEDDHGSGQRTDPR